MYGIRLLSMHRDKLPSLAIVLTTPLYSDMGQALLVLSWPPEKTMSPRTLVWDCRILHERLHFLPILSLRESLVSVNNTKDNMQAEKSYKFILMVCERGGQRFAANHCHTTTYLPGNWILRILLKSQEKCRGWLACVFVFQANLSELHTFMSMCP